jgi:hypothetical protein
MAEAFTKEDAHSFFKEIWELYRETDRKFQETDRKWEETRLQFQETDRLLTEKFQKTDRKFQETDRLLTEKFQETDKKIKEVSKQIGDLGGRLGEFVEEMVRPAVVRLFQQRGLRVHEAISDIRAYDDNGNFKLQLDILVINQNEAIAVECKSKCSEDDVNEHIERLGKMKEFLPRYAEYNISGAIASMVMPEDVGKYAYRKGLYVLVQNGDIVEIKNDDKFKPRLW